MTPLGPDEVRRRAQAWRDGLDKGVPMSGVAAALGLKASTFNHWRLTFQSPEDALASIVESVPVLTAPPALTPREVQDAAFWRRRAQEAEARLLEAEHLAEMLAGARETPCAPPTWLASEPRKHGRSILIAHTSDVHMGEVIAADEIEGINAFDPDICRERMKRYFEALCIIGPRWLVDCTCDGVLLTMGGDLTSGDIHEELARTNALTTPEQVAAVVEIYDAGLRMLLAHFPRAHVVAVPGNHGRLTTKPIAKLAARLSYDIMAASMLRDRFRDEPRVTWSIASGADVRLPVYGRTILVTHGDRIGTSGGQGFAGPVLPIIRGSRKVLLQSMSAGLGCDLILMGHYHTSAQPPGVLANGSVPGYSEYGHGLRAAVDTPRQWMARFALRRGLCETLAVQLEEPRMAKPRHRVPAGMRAT